MPEPQTITISLRRHYPDQVHDKNNHGKVSVIGYNLSLSFSKSQVMIYVLQGTP